MKKTINHVTYNTDTAEFLRYEDNGRDYTDCRYEWRALYRTKKGKWFLHCEGGARTRFASTLSDGSSGSGQMIIPISYGDVKKFVRDPFFDLTGHIYWLQHSK